MLHTIGANSYTKYTGLEGLQKDSVDLCLTYCGWENCMPSHRFGPNRRSSYILHMVKHGKGILEMNDKVYQIGQGEAFMIPPGVEAWYEADKEEPWAYMWLGFAGLKADECVGSAGFSLKKPVRKINCMQELQGYIDRIIEASQLTYANELKRNGLLLMSFSELIEDYQGSEDAKRGVTQHPYPRTVYVQQAVEYIVHHYNERLKINELADYIGVNRSYLTSNFKQSMGCSPQEYLVNLRMEKAKMFLKTTDMPISAVAGAVGYVDQLAFSKVFKQRCKMSPSMYKEEMHQQEQNGDEQGKNK